MCVHTVVIPCCGVRTVASQEVKDRGAVHARTVDQLHFTLGGDGTVARLVRLGMPAPPRGRDNALPVPPLLRDYMRQSTWTVVQVHTATWPHEDPAFVLVRESFDLVWPALDAHVSARKAPPPRGKPIRLQFGEVRVGEAAIGKMKQLFAALDIDRNGLLEPSDFTSRLKSCKEKEKAMQKFAAV